MEDRSVPVVIDGKNHELLLTSKAVDVLAKRYGGIENIGDFAQGAGVAEIIFVLTLLANQSTLVYNLRHKDAPRELLVEEEVALLTSPFELAGFKGQIMEAMTKGMKRNVQSAPDDDEEKNTQAG